MIIQGDFYRLIPVDDASSKFDLELLRSIGGKNPRQEFKLEGYAYTMESAIKKIINYAIHGKYGDETITLKQYLDAYREENNKIREQLV